MARGAAVGFKTFDDLKDFLGPAGGGNVWHHVVEQRQPLIDRFGAAAIHNTHNVVSVTPQVNQVIADYYSRNRRFTGGQPVRQWIGSRSFDEQTRFGKNILNRVLAGKPLP